MKKLLIISLTIILTSSSFSQDKPAVSTEKNTLKINTLSLFLGTGSIFYEHKVSEMTSAQLGVAYMSFKLGNTKFTGLILTPEFRIYPKKNAIDGFYLAPYLRYQSFTVENKVVAPAIKGSLISMGGGILFGRQWITNSGFTMDLFFGGHYGSAKVKADSGTESIDSDFFDGFKTRMGFALGFSF
jgi:hypothetical protein